MNEKKKLNLLPPEAKSKYANKYLKLTAAVIAGFFILLLLIQYCQIGVLTLQTNKILADNTGKPFEQLEAARWLEYLKPDGKIIVNTQQIDPMPVVMGAAEYPDGIIEALKVSGADIETVDALPMAVEAGNSKAVNVILIGAMAKNMTVVAKDKWLKALEESVPPKFLDLNMKAFEMGYSI